MKHNLHINLTKSIHSHRLLSGSARFGSIVLIMASSVGWLAGDTIPLGDTAAAAVLYDLSGTSVCSQSGVSSASCSAGGATAEAIVTNGQGGLARVSLGSNATAGAAVTAYFMGLEGPANVNVPIIINGSASTQDNSADYGASFAAYYIYQGSSTGYNELSQYFASSNTCSALAYTGVPCMAAGQFNLNTSVTSDTLFYVLFEAAAGGTNASALIDPTITIDPKFAQASQFTLVANPGVFTPNVSGTPEPSSIALFTVALTVAAIARRKKVPGVLRSASSL